MISIIIITLNEEKYVGHLLSDLANQSEKPYEVIVIDSNSVDHTKEVVQRFSKKLPIVWLTEEKKGPSPARNKGANTALGDILIFFDADMRISDQHFLKKIKKMIINHPVIFPHIHIENANKKEKFAEKIMHFTVMLGRFLGQPGARGGCMIMKNELFKKVHGFNEHLKIAEDFDMVKKLKKEAKLYYADKVQVYESNRRYRRLGVTKTLWVWTKAGMITFFHKRPGEYQQVR